MIAGVVAAELRKIADALDAQPDAEIIKPYISFLGNTKEEFLSTARLLPRPLAKKIEGAESKWPSMRLTCTGMAIHVSASVPQSLTCELVEPARPAVYRCDPILSEAEEAEVIA